MDTRLRVAFLLVVRGILVCVVEKDRGLIWLRARCCWLCLMLDEKRCCSAKKQRYFMLASAVFLP